MRNTRKNTGSKGGSAIKLRTLLGLGLAAVAVMALAGSALAAPTADSVKPRTQSRSGRVDVFFEPVTGKSHYAVYRHSRRSSSNLDFQKLGVASLSGSLSTNDLSCSFSPEPSVGSSVYCQIVQPDINSPAYVVVTDTTVQDYHEYYYLVAGGVDSASASYNGNPEDYIIVSAFPPNQTRHGSYTEFTGACTGCHGLHSAQSSQKLLKGPTATDLCATCHDGSVSKYDEVRGRVFMGSSRHAPAPAGPFGNQLQDSSNPGFGLDGRRAPNPPSPDWASSVHNVFRQSGPVYAYVYQAPGSGFCYDVYDSSKCKKADYVASAGSGTDVSPIGWNNLLSCVSCHEPHNKFDNFRLLRTDINDTRNGDSGPSALITGVSGNRLSVDSADGFSVGDVVSVNGQISVVDAVYPNELLVRNSVIASSGDYVSRLGPMLAIRGLSETGTVSKGQARWPKAYELLGAITGSNASDTVYISQTKFLANTARFCSQCHRAFYNKTVRTADDRVISRMYTLMSSSPQPQSSDDKVIRQYFRDLAALGRTDSSVPSAPSQVTSYCGSACHGMKYVNDKVEKEIYGSHNGQWVYIGWTTGNRALDKAAGADMSMVPGAGHRHPTQVPADRALYSGKIIDGPVGAFTRAGYVDSSYSQQRVKPGPVNVGLPLEGVVDENTSIDSSLPYQYKYARNDVVCLSCHMAHGSRTGVGTTDSSGNWTDPFLVGDYKVASAYRNGGNNGTDASNLTQVFGYWYQEDNSGSSYVRKGVSTVLARMEPMASVCFRCHSVK